MAHYGCTIIISVRVWRESGLSVLCPQEVAKSLPIAFPWVSEAEGFPNSLTVSILPEGREESRETPHLPFP